LRIYGATPITFPRVAVKNHILGTLRIKKGTVVLPFTGKSHVNTESFEDPETFNPDRWILKKEEIMKDGFCWLPFWSGTRNCIGQHLVMIEMKIILAYLIENYEFKRQENYKLMMGMKFGYQPVNDIEMDFIRRQK